MVKLDIFNKAQSRLLLVPIVVAVLLPSGACESTGNKKEAPASSSPAASATPPVAEKKVVPGASAPNLLHRQPFEFRGPGQRLAKAVGNFTITGAPRYFGPHNLYMLIDGGADAFVSRGLKEMVTADYAAEDKPGVTITVEIYDMANPKNAAARFTRFLEGRDDPDAAGKGLPGAIAPRGLMGAANATFWKNKYVVCLTLLDESDNANKDSLTSLGAELLPKFAQAIDDAISI